MFIRKLILASSLVFSWSLIARETSDVVVMNNGDHFTCKIKKLDAGVLYVGLDYADGDVSIDWKKVARIESNQLFVIKTQDGSVLRGALRIPATAEVQQPKQLEIPESPGAGKPARVENSQIVDVRQTADRPLERLSGNVSAGMTYSKGNDATQYNIASQTQYQEERWAAQANLSSNLVANSGTTTSTRNSLSTNSYHLLPWHNYFYGGVADLLQSSVQGIRLQASLGGGVGRFLIDKDRARIALMGGLVWQTTQYEVKNTAQPVQNIAAGLIGMKVSLFQFGKTQLNIGAEVLPALSGRGRVRFNTHASYFVKVFGTISWVSTFYGNWDTNPPPGFSSSDYGTTSGLSWGFGK